MDSETSPCFRHQIPISEAANHRIMQASRESTSQDRMAEVLLSLPPLGLKLHKAPSFMDLIETRLFPEEIKPNLSTDTNPKKASNADIFLLRIGTWQRVAHYKEDLVAKCYFAKRKLIWEILEKGLKRKIQMQWEHIQAIRAEIKENQPGILEIELSQPPSFFCETEPQPRKHTLWDNASDFTGGQAMICRRHFIQFPPGALNKLYEKLLQHEPRFFQMSQRPFPSVHSPYFDLDLYNLGSEISIDCNGNGLEIHCVPKPSYSIGFNNVDSDIYFDFQHTPYSSVIMPLRPVQVRHDQESQSICTQSSIPSSDFSPTSDERISIESLSNMAHWSHQGDNYANIEERDELQDPFSIGLGTMSQDNPLISHRNCDLQRIFNEELALNNTHSVELMGNKSWFLNYSGAEAEEINSSNHEYGSGVSGNSDCRFYPQSMSWIEAEDKLAYTNYGTRQTMSHFLGNENLVCPWM